MKRRSTNAAVARRAREKKTPVPVVGIGASAGGISALRAVIPAIPPDSGLAYVVVQHLDPEHASMLAAVLASVSRVPVTEIRKATPVKPDHIYVIAPNTTLTLVADRLQTAEPSQRRGFRTPIDAFLVSLADARGEKAASVILSGTGSDGTLGIRAIKEHGGLAIAQQGAEYDGMMRSAVATGLVDFVLPAEAIPAKLVDYFRHLTEVDGRKGPDGVRTEAVEQIAKICALLRSRTGNDFSGYKDKTVARRVQRRMQVLQIAELPQFVARLRSDPHEVDALLQDMLIGVTNFFRDPRSFAALEHDVIPLLFDGKGPDDTLRVWVPGCSTGEEAYSIAILLREHASKASGAPSLQIFASDIDEQALQIARVGRFPAAIEKDVPERLLEKYFTREDGTYRVAHELREICLFSVHNLLSDAPFSRLDLISCRNLLIYLGPELQSRLIPLFHYALRDAGYLFLGTSENVTRHSRLFATLDKTHRIFQRRGHLERKLPEFPLTTPEVGGRRLPEVVRPESGPGSLQSLAERQLIDRYGPAYVVTNADGDLLHASGRTGKYLELAPGAPKTDIFSMARRGLRAELRAGMHKAVTGGEAVFQNDISVGTNGGRQTLNLIVHPLRPAQSADPLYMIVFQDVGGIRPSDGPATEAMLGETESSTLRQLESELRATKERLQSTTEELESSNEELKSGNEELSSINEELQSTNEELETSKEELQSMNEELQTVNSELNMRVEELSRANSDIANLLESTQIAAVFLDRNLAIKSFTPAARDVFRLVDSDAGRPIAHVRARFSLDTVQADAERVLRTLATIERQVKSNDNETRFVMRLLPYRTAENVIAGVVITFMDVTKITAAEARIGELTYDLHERLQSLETLLDLLPVGILILEEIPADMVRVNRYGARLLGGSDEGAALRPIAAELRLMDQGRPLEPAEGPLRKAIGSGRPVPGFEGQLMRPDGGLVDVLVSATPLFGEDGQVRGAIAAIVDVSERNRDEAQRQVLLHELQHRVKNIITTVGALATRMLKSSASLAEFNEAFMGRLNAMAKTHELLSASSWRGAGLRPLIDAIVVSYVSNDGANLKVAGPDVMLAPNSAATLGLVLYELATNAAKYGAWADRGGHVDVSWQVAERDDKLKLSWIESGGPPISSPAPEGFGTVFAKRSVAYELGGEFELELRPSGLHCRIEFPLRRNTLGGRAASKSPSHAEDSK